MIFVDTGAFLARYLSRDQHHKKARAAWERLRTRPEPCVTTNFVIDEVITLLGRWTDPAFAAERARRIYASQQLSVVRPDQELELEAVDQFERLAARGASFTDCVSFVVMERQGIERAFAFDRDFVKAGFRLWPGR